MSQTTDAQCRYMKEAYPTLSAADTCGGHRHEPRVFALARALAAAVHETEPTDEQVGWFVEDADAVVDNFDPTPDEWTASTFTHTKEVGLDLTLTINGRPYVVQDNAGSGEVCHPVARATWESWHADDAEVSR